MSKSTPKSKRPTKKKPGEDCPSAPSLARDELREMIGKCRDAQWSIFHACMGTATRKMMGEELLDYMAELESSLDRAYDRMHARLKSLKNC
jgi:hypothetical protein